MTAVDLIFRVMIVGLIGWFIDKYWPMVEPFKALFRVIMVVICICYLLTFLGIALPFHIVLP